MSSRNPYKQRTVFRGEVEVNGSFAPAGAGAVTDVRGAGFTVARSAAGRFTVTLDKVFPMLVSATATVQLAAAADMNAQIGTVDLANRTIIIRTIAVATETDIAANANNRVNFRLVLRDTAMTT